MARAALIRFLIAVVIVAPVVRMTCDVTCIQPVPPPSCHAPASPTDTSDDGCSHDHIGHVARIVDAALLIAVMPAEVTFSLHVSALDFVLSPARGAAGRAGRPLVLRV